MCHVDVTGVHLISIHAPPRGATETLRMLGYAATFQFPPLCEGRRGQSKGHPQWLQISIHAPPRGATRRRHRAASASSDFNSRPSVRGDAVLQRAADGNANFNSRPSARGDSTGGGGGHGEQISIFAPPRGAKRHCSRKNRLSLTFQFSPLREGRRNVEAPCRGGRDFNSRPSARGDARHTAHMKP